MITLTEAAKTKILEVMDADERSGMALRLEITGRGPGGYQYSLRFVPEDEKKSIDQNMDGGGFEVIIDPVSMEKLKGATVDYTEDSFQRGFTIDNPNPAWDDPTAQAVQEVLDQRINPGIAGHGGVVTLLDYKDHTAYITMGGGCQGCGMANVTLSQGVDVMIREAIPEVQKVVDTTDHAGGLNPYFQSTSDGESPLS